MARHVGSKWRKTEALLKHSEIRQLIAPTDWMTEESLRHMLDTYGMVYVKPVVGMHGRGVMKVERLFGQGLGVDQPYRYQVGVIRRSFASFGQLFADLLKETGGKPYLVQRGINLLRYRNRPFDLRVMAQLTPNKKWETTGIIGRVAHKGKIVTNYHSGGSLHAVDEVLTPYAQGKEKAAFIKRLKEIGELVGNQMYKHFPAVTEIGLDIGISSDLQPWIIEVNTSPDFYVFCKLADKSVFRKVRRYAKANGRM
ncbi:MAG: YheC/YheD family protein [Gorillibacterium sp.]|nr:YheC/YheD family protein [Gorillibacterium sp.]